MKKQLDYLPTCADYARYLQVASFKFRLSIDECRNKYGLFTVGQWIELLSNPTEQKI